VERSVRRGVSRMPSPRQDGCRIEAGKRRGCGPTRASQAERFRHGNARRNAKRRHNPVCVHAAGNVTYGLHDALHALMSCVLPAISPGKRCAAVEKTVKNADPGHCAWKNFSEGFDSSPHDGGQLETYRTKQLRQKSSQRSADGGDRKSAMVDGGSTTKPHKGAESDEPAEATKFQAPGHC